MKRIPFVALLAALISFAPSFAQTSTELVFKNPVLVSGTDKQLNAVYRFTNVTNGTDALLKIASASEETVLVNNIDLTQYGWDKALQPEIGKAGNVPANQEWWVRFNLQFVHSGTFTKKRLDKFYATAIDVDGDNYVIAEYIQMYKPDSVTYRNVTKLTQRTPFNAGINPDSKTNLSQGPVLNYTNIDTLGTPVMVTYTFLNTDEINFVYGAKVGHGISNAGLRLNSIWFRTFNLNMNTPLPISNTDFSVAYAGHVAAFSWKGVAQDNISNYSIERSTNGVTFTKIGEVDAKAGSSNYSFADMYPTSASGVVYYRMLFREKSGEAKYSAVKMVQLNKQRNTGLSVYPNPAQSSTHVTLPQAWQSKSVQISVYNAAGVQVQVVNRAVASQTETINVSNLPRGYYLIKARCGEEAAEERIVRN